jgi:hypothetical protein
MIVMALIADIRRAAGVLGTEVPLAAALVGLDVAARLLPHAPNFTPVAASAIFAGMMFRTRSLALAVPVTAMLLSDLVLGSYDWRLMGVVYASLALPAVLAMWGRKFRLPIVVVPVVLSSSLMFFMTTNFAVWAFSGMYPDDLGGLIRCYVAALPFLQNTVTGDIVWSAALFGTWWLARLAFSPSQATPRVARSLSSGGAARRPVGSMRATV